MVRLHTQAWLLASVATSVHGRGFRGRILRPRDTTYSSNVRDATPFAPFGFPGQTTSVDAGVTYFLTGQSPHPFFGNIVNSGSIVVTQADAFLGTGGIVSTPLSVQYIGGGITDGVLTTNAGSLISLNDYGDTSLVSPSLYNWQLYSMVNGGTIQWCGNGAPPTGSTFTLNCASDTCENDGLITWEQYNNDNGVLFTWNAGVNATTTGQAFAPTNNGAFRLIRTDLVLVQDVVSSNGRSGCFVLGDEGLLSLGSPLSGTNANAITFAQQSIYFTTSNAGLYLFPTVYRAGGTFQASLYGFGQGNFIAFTEILLPVANPLTGAAPISYSGSTLTITFAVTGSIALNIGPGYTASLFQVTTEPDPLRAPQALAAVVYNGAAPARAPPAVCVVNYPTCADPAVTVSATFASTVSSTSTSAAASLTTVYVTSTLTSIGIDTPSTLTIPPVGTGPGTVTGTVEIISPGATTVYVTITSTSIGIDTPSTTTIPPAGTGPGTVTGTIEIVNPGVTTVYVTSTLTSVGVDAPSTTTIPPVGTGPGTVTGTVEIVNPGVTTVYVTTTLISDGISAASTTTIPPAGTGPGTITGTVEIINPAQFVTLTTISGTEPPFTTTIAPTGTAPGTVLIVDPAVYVTVTAVSVGASAPVTYTIQPTGTAPGTVVVVEPTNANFVTSTFAYTGTVGFSSAVTVSTVQPSGTAPGTVYVSLVDAVLATITRPYSGSQTITSTIAPTDGVPGTIEILTPTVSRPAVLTTTVGPNQCVCRPVPTA